jgi:hypothetical protein
MFLSTRQSEDTPVGCALLRLCRSGSLLGLVELPISDLPVVALHNEHCARVSSTLQLNALLENEIVPFEDIQTVIAVINTLVDTVAQIHRRHRPSSQRDWLSSTASERRQQRSSA